MRNAVIPSITPPTEQLGNARGFKRAYKACEACRRSKSRCELNGDSSVCTRCVRERRECVFPSTRSSKRARRTDGSSGRRRLQQVDKGRQRSSNARATPSSPQTSRSRSTGDPATDAGEQDTHGRMPEATQLNRPANLHRGVVQTFVTSSTDAMGLLFQAAEQNDSDSDTDQDATNSGHGHLPASSRRLGDDLSDTASPYMSSETQLPPHLTKETLALWNQHRFVLQGWFSAFEAISYLEL